MISLRVFDNMGALESYILDQVKDCLYNEIADEAEHAIQRHVESDVYNAYEPSEYHRRGLLRSASNLDRYLNGFTLTIYDNTPGNTPIANGHRPTGIELSEIISTGAQGHGYGKWHNAFARPYMKNAEDEVKGMVGSILRSRFS